MYLCLIQNKFWEDEIMYEKITMTNVIEYNTCSSIVEYSKLHLITVGKCVRRILACLTCSGTYCVEFVDVRDPSLKLAGCFGFFFIFIHNYKHLINISFYNFVLEVR